MNLCIIARADLTGLGIQSRNWVRLLKPQKLVVINSTSFNKNQQHLEWYSGYGGYTIDGFIKTNEILPILRGVDVLLTFEIPYSYELIRVAKANGVKTIIQNNWEFTDYLRQPHLPLPDLLVNHSYWHLKEQEKLFPNITDYCPTPVFIEDWDQVMLHNMDRDLTKRRFLHVAGRRTYEDRNGTNDLIEVMKLIPADIDFELVIKSQTADIAATTDPRITVDTSSPVDEKELYKDFDAMIMPRRYGGACLPMNESLAAGLPVIMPDIDPNNKVLPKEWLVRASHKGTFMTRTEIDLFSVDHNSLADKIIELATDPEENIIAHKIRAREIACSEYSSETVLEKWAGLMTKIGL
jgi:glycosyltransferase involved in cell wall biosynthesis